MSEERLQTFQIVPPHNLERNPAADTGLVQSLVANLKANSFFFYVEDSALASGVLFLEPITVRQVQAVVDRFYKGCKVLPFMPPQHAYPATGKINLFRRPKTPQRDYLRIRPVDDLKKDDPLKSLTDIFTATPAEDGAFFGVNINNPFLTMRETELGFWSKVGVFMARSFTEQGDTRLAAQNRREFQEFEAYIKQRRSLQPAPVTPYVGYMTQTNARWGTLGDLSRVMARYSADFAMFHDTDTLSKRHTGLDHQQEHFDYFFPTFEIDNHILATSNGNQMDMTWDYFLPAAEIAALWHLPDQTFTGTYWRVPPPRHTDLPQALRGLTQGVYVGEAEIDGGRQKVFLPVEEQLRHTLLIGKTGVGKSSLMHRMIHEDIAAGKSVVVVDPHNDLVDDILAHSIPANRIDDVVLIDFRQVSDHPVGINPILSPSGSNRVADDFIETLVRVFDAKELKDTQMASFLQLALLTLQAKDKPVIDDIEPLFTDEVHRNQIVKQSDNLKLRKRWQRFKTAPNRQASVTGLMRRLDELTETNEMLVVTSHPQPLAIGELAAQGKVILIACGDSDNPPLSRKHRYLLTTLLVTQLLDAGYMGLLREQEKPVMLYIDEAKNFVTAPLDRILEDARKFNLGMVLAAQGFSQLSKNVQNAIDNNVGSFFVFETSEDIAKDFKPYFQDTFPPEELVKLGKFKTATSISYDGDRQPPFLMYTVEPPQTDSNHAEQVKQRSIAQYTPLTYAEAQQAYEARLDALDAFHDQTDSDDPDEFIQPE